MLAAASLLRTGALAPESKPEEAYFSALGLLLALFQAERVFLFEAAPVRGAGEAPALGRALSTRNADDEPVPEPEKKAPLAILAKALKTNRPVAGESTPAGASHDEVAARAHGVAFPLEAAGSPQGALYVENRFQPIVLSRENLRVSRAVASILGALIHAERIARENATLWCDLCRLREERQPAAAAPAPPRPSEGPRHARRSQLKGQYSAIIGSSPKMLEILQVLDRISTSNAPVLINGESGTGKELIANAVHENSPRRGKVFVSENCGALTETLLESELFGYVKGAFTGANKDHKGLFELAEGGTLFLDEVGDMSPSMQKKLLRVLQEGVIRRVGGKDYIGVDVRIISATNKDLMDEVRSGNFREDLYYRLNVINLRLPPLRERKEDIPALVSHVLAELGKESGVLKSIEPAALDRLAAYGWPGNIRELRNEIKRLHALSDGNIGPRDLSDTILAGESREASLHDLERQLSNLPLKDATERLERELIRLAMIQCRGNKSLMAKMLQVPKTSLYNKISKYGLDRGV